ncbi:MAG: alpha-galactosidase [Chloroflexi bacterium]|nr:alpha-galactosidase [Chloroflexota bacterium]
MPILSTPQTWILKTAHTAYALGLNSFGTLVHRYWGPRLDSPDDYRPAQDYIGWSSFNGPGQLNAAEFPAYAGASYVEPCLKITQPDGTRDTVLRFSSAHVDGDSLKLTLQDADYPLTVTLHYRVHAQYDLVERWTEVRNDGDGAVSLERVLSASWNMPHGGQYRLRHMTGKWFDEWTPQCEPLTSGVKVLESRRLTTSHNHNPFWTLDSDASEEHGDVWFGTLAWSGNWTLKAEVTDFHATRILTGLNDYDFTWRLNPGETFTTPSALAGYSSGGYGAASRILHDYVRETLLPHPGAVRKVIFNSWEVSTFHVDEASQMRFAEIAAGLGVELFVMDDGWFKGRNKDDAGLGDWVPDPTKFPNGLQPLAAHIKSLGMEFGLWIEPEMVNPDSDLYRRSPDWVIHFPTRERTEMRQQLILNLGRTDVQDYLIDSISAILSTVEISFIKWDMNRNVSEPGWPDAPGDPRELWVRYVQGLYRVWGTLRERFPQVIWQSCSGGGGRADFGILKYADQIWISDNTIPTRRLPMQLAYLSAFPAATMEAWVTDTGDPYVSLAFRMHVSMFGALGIGANITKWDAAEKDVAQVLISQYKDFRHILHQGDLYRLDTPAGYTAVQVVSKDRRESVVFAFRTHIPDPAHPLNLRLRGLHPAANYTLNTLEIPVEDGSHAGHGFPFGLVADQTEGKRSGAAWMSPGALPVYLANFDSRVMVLQQV